MVNPTANPTANLYCVVYRTGGTANFQWRATVAMSKDEAIKAKAATERMGYKAMLYKYSDLLTVGMPETYE